MKSSNKVYTDNIKPKHGSSVGGTAHNPEISDICFPVGRSGTLNDHIKSSTLFGGWHLTAYIYVGS